MKFIIFITSLFISYQAFTSCHQAVDYLNKEDIRAAMDRIKSTYPLRGEALKKMIEIEGLLRNLRNAIWEKNDQACSAQLGVVTNAWEPLKAEYTTRR